MPEDLKLSREETKAIVKEAISEWLEGKYAQFGKYTLHGLAAAALAAATYFLATHGWLK